MLMLWLENTKLDGLFVRCFFFFFFPEIKHNSLRNQFRGSEVIPLLNSMTMTILGSVWFLRKCWGKDVVIFCVLVPDL